MSTNVHTRIDDYKVHINAFIDDYVNKINLEFCHKSCLLDVIFKVEFFSANINKDFTLAKHPPLASTKYVLSLSRNLWSHFVRESA